jgi:hypothetical protein
MSGSRDFNECTVCSEFLLARKFLLARRLGTCAFSALLALIGIVSAVCVAAAGSVQLVKGWQGPYDTSQGWQPVTTEKPPCAFAAEPMIAAGPVKLPDNNPPQPFVRVFQNWNFTDYGDANFNWVHSEGLRGFFAGIGLPGNYGIGQPQILYDQPAGDPAGFGHFITVAQAHDPATQRSWITVGTTYVPQGYIQQPSGAAFRDCLFVIDANSMPANVPSANYWADEPRVGVSKNSLFITADMRAFDGNSTFQYSKLWMIPKANVYNRPTGSCPLENVGYYFWYGLQNADGTPAYQVIPAKTYDYNDPTIYLVSAHWNGGSELTLWTVNDAKPSISPGLKGMAVATQPYSPPPPVPQKPTAAVPAPPLITTSNARLVNAVYQPNSGLWTVHATACPWNSNLSCIKWYALNPLNPIMGAVLQEEAFGFTDSNVYAPTVAVSENGNAIFVFSSSDANHFVGVYAVGRDGRDPPSTVQISQNILLKPGVDVYTRGAPGIRSSADIDPIDDNRFWFIGAYPSGKFLACPDGSANYDWATWAGILSFTGPLPPLPPPLPQPPAPAPQ